MPNREFGSKLPSVNRPVPPQPAASAQDPRDEANPGRRIRSNGRAHSQPWPVPLTTLAELLYFDAASPYRPAKRFGLRNWLTAQVRTYLTRGAAYCVELDFERAIRFNAAYLTRRAEFVLARKRVHRGAELDGGKLAEILGMRYAAADAGFLGVWLQFVDGVADDLVEVSRSGHIEDVRWADAERYIDRAVAPRPRNLRRAGATPSTLSLREPVDEPLSLLGGYRRCKRILDALSSDDSAVVAAMLNSWECVRMQDPRVCGAEDWDAPIEVTSQIFLKINGHGPRSDVTEAREFRAPEQKQSHQPATLAGHCRKT